MENTYDRDKRKLEALAVRGGGGRSSGVLRSRLFGVGFHHSTTKPVYPKPGGMTVPTAKVDLVTTAQRGHMFPAINGDCVLTSIITPYMAKKRQTLAKRRLGSIRDVDTLLHFRNNVLKPALSDFCKHSKAPTLDDAAVDSLGTMVQTHSALEDTGRCGATPNIPITKEVYEHLTRCYFTDLVKPSEFSLPLQRFLGYPFDATLDRMTNTCILTLLSYHISGMGSNFRMSSFYGECKEFFGPVLWNSLERVQDKKKGQSAISEGTSRQASPDSSVSKVLANENLEMKVRPVRPGDKPATVCLKPAVTHMKKNFEANVPYFITDSDAIEHWLVSAWDLHRAGKGVVWSQDFSNMDLSATGANVTKDMMCHIFSHLGYDPANYLETLKVECQMIYGNRTVNTNQWAGMFSGHPATSATNFATGISRTLELACSISLLAGLRTGRGIREAMRKGDPIIIPADKLDKDGGGKFNISELRGFFKTMKASEVDEYISASGALVLSFLNYGDDGNQFLTIGPAICFDASKTYSERADAAAAFCKSFWDSVGCKVGREAGIQFLGRKFVDDSGYTNPYTNFYTLGRYVVKTFQPEYPKAGEIAYIGHASRILQLCEPGTGKSSDKQKRNSPGPLGSASSAWGLAKEINAGTLRACKSILSYVGEGGSCPPWLQKHYTFILPLSEACERFAKATSMAHLKQDVIDASRKFAETTDDPRAADSLLQLYLQGDNFDSGGIPDYLAALVPLLNLSSRDLISGAAFKKEEEELIKRIREAGAQEGAAGKGTIGVRSRTSTAEENLRTLDFARWFKDKFVNDTRIRKSLADPHIGYKLAARSLAEVAAKLTSSGFGSWQKGQTFY